MRTLVGRTTQTAHKGFLIQRIDWGTYETLTAWEPSALFTGHSTITYIDGQCWGRIGTDPLTADLDALVRGPNRTRLVRAWQAATYERAYAVLAEAVPGAEAGTRDMGEITLTKSTQTNNTQEN